MDPMSARRLVSCPNFDPMPHRHSEEFDYWLSLTKIKIGRWRPGLFRSIHPNDVSVPSSRWDRPPATPSVARRKYTGMAWTLSV